MLFVDDDPNVLRGIGKALRRQKWDMVFATGGPAGLEEVRQRGFDVVVSDMRMPELDGWGLLRQVRALDPTTFRIILSGYSELNTVPHTPSIAPPLAHQLFEKPCDLRVLAAAVDGSLIPSRFDGWGRRAAG
ncbi:MAG: response regulator [Proteobacteria bacterium]|nr:response regulator [Pseudomonadota bacterium]